MGLSSTSELQDRRLITRHHEKTTGFGVTYTTNNGHLAYWQGLNIWHKVCSEIPQKE